MRLTVPGIGGECGATLGVRTALCIRGCSWRPTPWRQAVKTAVFAAAVHGAAGL